MNPTSIHVVVDGGRRIRRKGGEGYTIRYETVDAKQVWLVGRDALREAGYCDRAVRGSGTPRYLLERAVENGRKRGCCWEKGRPSGSGSDGRGLMSKNKEESLHELMAGMKPRGKRPRNAGVLDSWIDRTEADFGIAASGRVRWLIASTVITAMLQRIGR